MNNFASFFAQASKSKNRKIKKGKYKGQPGSTTQKDFTPQGPMYHPTPGRSDAPSASTFKIS